MRRASLLFSLLISGTSFSAGATEDMMRFVCAEHHELSVVSTSIKLLTLNVSHGRNTALNQVFVGKKRTYENLDRIAALLSVTAPDVAALQEADAPSVWSSRFDHVDYIAEQSQYPCFVHGLHSQSWISTYGTALLSRSKLLHPGSVQFQPSPPSKQKGYVHAQLFLQTNSGMRRITIATVHFDFLSHRTRDSQVAEMVSGLSEFDSPLIVLGDINSEWSADESHVRALANKLNLQSFEPESEALGTYKKQTGKRLDWILISRELEFVDYKVLPDVVADHFAVYAEVVFDEHRK